MDYEIRKFREELVEFINKYPIPVEIKRLVFSEVYRMLEEASNQFIEQQKIEALKKAEEVKDE